MIGNQSVGDIVSLNSSLSECDFNLPCLIPLSYHREKQVPHIFTDVLRLDPSIVAVKHKARSKFLPNKVCVESKFLTDYKILHAFVKVWFKIINKDRILNI